MAQKKYVSLSKLSTFLDNLFGTFASLSHKHTMSDITDYTVDTALSSTSTNPVQNKVIDAEFDAMSDAMGALELAIDGKADASNLSSHTSNTSNPHGVTAEQTGALPINGGTLTGILYTAASTPLLIGKNGKVGLRAVTDEKNNVGQINISNAWYGNGNQWGSQISAYNGQTEKYNELRVSHNGVQYNSEDGVAHTVIHDGNVSDYAVPNTRTVNGKALSADITLSASDIGADVSGTAQTLSDDALASAKSYTDTKTSGLASTSSVNTNISNHDTSTSAHNDIRALITDLTTKLTNFLDVDDTTTDQLSEVLTLIDNNKGTLESLTTSKINVSDIIDNLTTNSASKVLSAAQGVEIKKLIDALQTALDETNAALDTKADASALSTKADKDHTHPEATISTAGLLSAEDKIQLDYGGIPIASTSGTGAAYTAVVNGMASLTVGMSFMMIPHTVSTSTSPTLNVNNLGAKTIRRRVSNATQSTSAGYNASWLSANKPIMVTYDGMFWIADILKPSAADVSGTMGVSNGGTGKNSITAGNFLVGNGTSAMTEKTPAEALTHMGITATATEINYMDGVTSNVQTQLDSISSEIADLKTTEPWTFTLEDGSTTTKLVYVSTLATENWTFTLEDGSTVTKGVCVK